MNVDQYQATCRARTVHLQLH